MTDQKDKHVNAYNRMLENAKTFIDEAEKEFGPKVQFGIDAAKDKISELGELTREEVDKIGDYLHRDLDDAGKFLQENGKELSDWLKFDIELIEDRFIDTFSVVADQTKVELALLADRANKVGVWKTGEITGIGTLVCKSCGEELHFHKPGHIPPCPKCKASEFKRPASS
ncbi:MAG: zinc ribbon-containing protein [Gammaproteobacteria bacterium]|nr:zinc ribbon-containing protein [Gammaproteobacteria bacterium]